MHPSEAFAFCPRCGVAQNCGVAQTATKQNAFDCPHCHFRYHFNAAIGVVGVIENTNSELFFIRRAREPGKGKLAFPGGFVDPGETAEEALRREVREEVGMEITNVRFLLSRPNLYAYRELVYSVCDLCFSATVSGSAGPLAESEVSAALWLNPTTVDPESLAFPSMTAALLQYNRG
jgi:ADP-ribose pyrophosphatase YjhB (NUDIX family)